MADHLWLLLSALLVFLMQAGFLCLESGRTRSKNSINVAAKNVSDFIVSSAVFWLVGFAIMFGSTWSGIIGLDGFAFGDHRNTFEITFFLFQMMFCGTAATLTSGAVAERATFLGYLIVTVILSALVYPVTGHWAWASAYNPANTGWLQNLGFVDFAGSTVVHSVGGWVALAAVIVIGPRLGRFDLNAKLPTGSNLPMASLGTLLIWFGWFGFNGGSTLEFNDSVPLILLNTSLSAIFGCLAAATLSQVRQGYVCVTQVLNGIIAGLVGITASCHAVSPAESALIGAVSGVVLYFGDNVMDRFKLDDALAVVPAHLFAGIWGTLAVALFGDPDILQTGLGQGQQLVAQCLGIASIGAYSFLVSYFLMRLITRFIPLRVSPDDERKGLNVTEHRASTELIDLLNSMEEQQSKGDFNSAVHEEPFTDVGQIAHKYNQVIARVNQEMVEKDLAIHQFRSSEARKSAILESSMDSIVTIDKAGVIIEFNYAAERTFGCHRNQVQGENFIELFVLPSDRNTINSSLKLQFSSTQGLILNRRNSLTLQRISEQPFPAEVTITNAHTGSAQDEYTLHIRDVTQHQKMQKRLKFLAYSDPLTSLSNRRFFLERLATVLTSAQHQSHRVAILFMDLDKFKKINDTLGHKAGDELLCEVARRLNELTRESDMVARWGGDEFILMIAGNITDSVIFDRAQTILEAMREPFKIVGKPFNLAASIGICIANNQDINVEQLIQSADIAMYAAKQKGRNNYQVFAPSMAQDASLSFIYEQEIRAGLENDEFFLLFQPKVYESANQIVGLEALIRWQHPERGVVSPVEFIPFAEESNFIIQIGELVIAKTLAQLCSWREKGLPVVPVAINISCKHLLSDNFVFYLKSELDRFGIEGKYLEIEITEGVLLDDMDRCIEVIADLKKMGLCVTIDDFGTGYSSLNYLKRLPIDVLKIDQSFVRECDTKSEDFQICSTIITLSNNLNLLTVAEGVETESQWRSLRQLNCTTFQGFLFYKPMNVEEIEGLLRSENIHFLDNFPQPQSRVTYID